jgi:hypothetical protein
MSPPDEAKISTEIATAAEEREAAEMAVREPGSLEAQGQAAATGAAEKSGLQVVPRPGMTSQVLTDVNGRPVTIYGQAEAASSTTLGHAEAMNELANNLAQSGDYEYITLQRSWRTATGREGTSSLIPDVIGVRRDGVVDAWEVLSKTDSEVALRARLQEGMQSLPVARRGTIEVIPPKPPTP